MEKKSSIYILLILVMVAWGFNVVATKILVTIFPPVMLTSFRIFTAGVTVFIILGMLKKVRLPSKREWKFILIGSVFNVIGHHYFLSVGLTQTSATNAGMILGLSPLLTTILAIFFLKDKLTVIRSIGILLGLGGVSFIVLSNGNLSGISTGDLCIFLSVLVIAISFIIIKKVSNTLDPRLMTGYMLVIGSFALFMISLLVEPHGIKEMANSELNTWMIFLASAVIATAIGHMVYNWTIGKVGAAEASIFTNLNPFFAVVGAVVFLQEKLVVSQLIGFALILVGVMFASGAYDEMKRYSKKKKEMVLPETI